MCNFNITFNTKEKEQGNAKLHIIDSLMFLLPFLYWIILFSFKNILLVYNCLFNVKNVSGERSAISNQVKNHKHFQ